MTYIVIRLESKREGSSSLSKNFKYQSRHVLSCLSAYFLSREFIHTFIHMFIHTFIHMFMYMFIRTFLHTFIYYKEREKKCIINILLYFYLKNSFAITSYIFSGHFVTLMQFLCPHRIILVTSRLDKDSMSS